MKPRPPKPAVLPNLPTWLPTPVKSQAQEWFEQLSMLEQTYREHPLERPGSGRRQAERQREVLLRLATDQRMESVWNFLMRKQQPPPPPALKEFFFYAFDAACHPRRLRTWKEKDAMAAKMSSAAQIARMLGNKQHALEIEKQLEKSLERIRHRIFKPGQELIFVKRRSKNDSARVYVLVLADVTKRCFGSASRGVLATTASVALQRTITKNVVHNFIKERRVT